MWIGILIVVFVLALAFTNGTNDNRKGAVTLIGSLTAIWFGAELANKFKGKDIVEAAILGSALFPLCVGIAASLTVLIATRIGMPISTTHVTCGSLFGIGLLTKQGNSRVIGSIVLAWVTTLPVAALIGAFCWIMLSQ